MHLYWYLNRIIFFFFLFLFSGCATFDGIAKGARSTATTINRSIKTVCVPRMGMMVCFDNRVQQAKRKKDPESAIPVAYQYTGNQHLGTWEFSAMRCNGAQVSLGGDYLSIYVIEESGARRMVEINGCQAVVSQIPVIQNTVLEGSAKEIACSPNPCDLMDNFSCPSSYPIDGLIWRIAAANDQALVLKNDDCVSYWTRTTEQI